MLDFVINILKRNSNQNINVIIYIFVNADKINNKKKKLRPNEYNHSMNWENKTKEEIKQIYIKRAKTKVKNIKNGLYLSSFAGKHHSEESKEKCRKSSIYLR